MKYILIAFFLYVNTIYSLDAQSKKELEDKRSKTLEEITYVDNLLKTMTSDTSDLKIQFYSGLKGMRSVLMDAVEESKRTKKGFST